MINCPSFSIVLCHNFILVTITLLYHYTVSRLIGKWLSHMFSIRTRKEIVESVQLLVVSYSRHQYKFNRAIFRLTSPKFINEKSRSNRRTRANIARREAINRREEHDHSTN